MWPALVSFVSSLMGNHFTHFCQALKNGQCSKAHDAYFGNKKLREVVLSKVNESLGPEHDHNSVLHYVAKLKMKTIYTELLYSDRCPGVPDLKNIQRRNCFHLICLDAKEPAKALNMLECTIGFLKGQKVDVAHLLAEKDEDGNTVLHLAAAVGLVECVDLLVSHGADMYAINNKEETAADVATHTNHKEIATKLETQMVFSNDSGEIDTDPALLQELAEQPTAMQDTELRSMKDQLLIETSEMLGVSLFTAEALLRYHGWSKEELLEAWMRDAADVCDKAGVQMPSSLGIHNMDDGERLMVEAACRASSTSSERECGICCLPSAVEVQVPCEHHFCRDCWKEYLEGKIKAGEAHSISCPEFGCYKLVPLDVIENTVSREMAQRFLNFDIKAFVDSNPNIRWCPHPGCGQAVALATPNEDPFDMGAQQVDNLSRLKERSGRVAHCGEHHYFCWDCMGEAHEPCSCEEWKKWLDLIEEMRPKVGDKTSAESDEAASFRWLASRSKPCPKCRVPIEKTEGCNHMCCKKCKHDFCWVCLDNWSCHGSSTGGYFECNRYDAQKKAHELLNHRRDKIAEEYAELERQGRFLHHYERYKGHGQSLELEEPFLYKARHKMEHLAMSVQSLEQNGGSGGHMPRKRSHTMLPIGSKVGPEFMVFIEEAVRELLNDRRVLRGSYGFAYFIQGHMARRVFENMQGALEQVTELLAEVVARPHLRKPRHEIIRITRQARDKRHHLIRQVHIGLPEMTPPMLPPRRQTFPWMQGGVLDEGPPSDLEYEQRLLRRLLREERERRSPSPPPPSISSLNPSRERRSLPSRTGRLFNRNRSRDDDGNLRHILEISRLEYEAEQQLNKDVELAKALSMQEKQPSPKEPSPSGSYEDVDVDRFSEDSQTPLHSVNSWLNIPNEPRDETWVNLYHRRSHSRSPPPSWPTWNLERRNTRDDDSQNNLLLPPIPPRTLSPLNYSPTPNGDPMGLLSPVQTAPVTPPSPEQLSLTVPRELSLTVPSDISLTTPTEPERDSIHSPHTSPPPVPIDVDEWGPLYDEDEDLRRAIEMSLASTNQDGSLQVSQDRVRTREETGLTINGPHFVDYDDHFEGRNGVDTCDPSDMRTDHHSSVVTLPPELRHLLTSSNRTGAHV